MMKIYRNMMSLGTVTAFYLYLNDEELMKNKNILQIIKFRIEVLKTTGVAFCTKNHFGSSNTKKDKNCICLACSVNNPEAIIEGFQCFKNWIQN